MTGGFPEFVRRSRQLHVGSSGADAFPEIDYDKIDKSRGLELSLVTSAKTDEEGRRLLSLLGMPFARTERPLDRPGASRRHLNGQKCLIVKAAGPQSFRLGR